MMINENSDNPNNNNNNNMDHSILSTNNNVENSNDPTTSTTTIINNNNFATTVTPPAGASAVTAAMVATTIDGNNHIPICIATPNSANLVVITNNNNGNSTTVAAGAIAATANNISCNQQYVNNGNNAPTIIASNETTNLSNNNNLNQNSQQQYNPSAAAIAAAAEDTEMRHRFKVVKLVSSQPYTRGRWTCFDYNDENQNTINISRHVPVNKIHPNGHGDGGVMNVSDHNCNNMNSTENGAAGGAAQTGAVGNGGGDQAEVAIDNKIEQAMDLVKSHLMFAVREEVDVLRERIKELENDIQILKAHATPETLALLSNRSTSIPNPIEPWSLSSPSDLFSSFVRMYLFLPNLVLVCRFCGLSLILNQCLAFLDVF